MCRQRCALLWVALCGPALLGRPALANEANFQPFLLGDRAIGMGGAFAALATDASATYYNPAGLASGPGAGLALSLPLYGFVERTIPGALVIPPGARASLESQSFVTIPSTFIVATRFGVPDPEDEARPDAVAFSILVPYDEGYSGLVQLDAPSQTRALSMNLQDQTLWIGPSFAHRVSRRLSLGASLFAVYRTLSVGVGTDDASGAGTGPASFTHVESNVALSTTEVLLRAGLLYHWTDRTSFGLVLMSPSLRLLGSGSVSEIMAVSDPSTGTSTFVSRQQGGLRANSHTPGEIRAGVATRWSQEATTALDVELHSPTSYELLAASSQVDLAALPGLLGFFSPYVELGPVVNVNVGGELYLGPSWPLRLGAFTDLSAARPPVPSDPAPLAHEDRYGVTASIGIHRRTFALDIGVEYAFASGTGPIAANTQTLSLGSIHEQEVLFYVSGIQSLEHLLTRDLQGWLTHAVERVETEKAGGAPTASPPASEPAGGE